MVAPLRKNIDTQTSRNTNPKKKGVIKRGMGKFKEDFKRTSKIEEGSLAQITRDAYRSLFPKKK